MQIEDALARFLVQLEADGRSPHTIGQYRRHIRLFARWAACVALCGDVSRIDHQAIARFLTARQAKCRPDGGKKKVGSMNALRSSLKGFFSYLHRAGDLADDPGRMVRRALCGRPPPKTLSAQERKRLLTTLARATGPEAERDYLLFHLMLATGIRLSSALSLDTGDVDLDRRELRLRDTKGNRPALVFLGDRIVDHLAGYLRGRDDGVLFTARSGQRLSRRHAHRRFSQWLKQAGIERILSPHSTRHSFASDLYQRTGDIFLVKEALHHRSIASTLVYARPSEERLRRALA